MRKLDYTMACARALEIRDVATSLAQISGDGEAQVFSANVLLRGPMVDGMSFEQLRCAHTVINLRVEADSFAHLADSDRSLLNSLHFPMANKVNVYDTESPHVRKWLADILRHFQGPIEFPILVHCKHGRDRTGVVVAVLLLLLGVPKNVVRQDFLSTEDASAADLQKTFAGISTKGGVDKYFEGMIDVEAIRTKLSLPYIQQTRRQLFREAAKAVKNRLEITVPCEDLLELCLGGLRLKSDDAEMHAAAGWALIRLGRHDEGYQALGEGLRLSDSVFVKPEIVSMMKREMEALEHRAPKDIT